MACCYIAAFCIGQLIKVCQFLDVDNTIRYNEDEPDLQHISTNSKSAGHTRSGVEQDSLVLSLSGLTCSGCSSSVESALSSHPQVDQVRVSLALQQATVIGKTPVLDKESIRRVVLDLGYGAELGPRSPQEIINVLKSKEEIARLKSSFSQLAGCASIIQVVGLLLSKLGRSELPWSILYLVHFLCASLTLFAQYNYIAWIHIDGWKWVRGGQPNMNTLISSSISLGTLFSFIDLAARGPFKAAAYYNTVIGLALVVVSGRYLETMSRRTASEDLIRVYAITLLLLAIEIAHQQQLVPQSFLRPLDEIVIAPFSTIPCDCYVTLGSSSVNQAIVTGESMPVKKSVGDCLLGGTRNMGNELVGVVHQEQARSFYAQLVQSAVQASGSKGEEYQALDTVMKYFVLCVISLGVWVPLKDIYWSVDSLDYESLRHAITRSMTILTCACPCALGLAIPSAVIAAANVASQKGILITKGFSTIQKLDSTRSIVFDKTGTLTRAMLDIDSFDIVDVWAKRSAEFWTYVCAVEEESVMSHPIGRAIFSSGLAHLDGPWLETKALVEAQRIASESGKGISGDVSIGQEPWRRVNIGNLRYLQSCSVSGLPEPLEQQDHGVIAVYVGIDHAFVGTLWITVKPFHKSFSSTTTDRLQDAIRDNAATMIKQLKLMGYETNLLTGDVAQSAHRVSQLLEIPVLASEATPMDKLSCIKRLREDRGVVTMVGDGLNDAPSLAAADVGIALYHEAAAPMVGASVVILNSRLDSIPLLFEITKHTVRQIQFNLAWVFGYNVLALSMAAGFISPFGIVLTPPLAAALMSFSSTFVTLNGLWLRSRLTALGSP
ncbi:hypothetical protein FZEAL_6539 [Fusarium zealandicum]|uniref:HMA domain-containing protein n=1 Tax=Fusarium zealandicum TaxID=1053134 RepID=A0A8H4UIC6_9HYPO|nr:hypothetical protein FZEAL_6539 [Fusarium zealandicum]